MKLADGSTSSFDGRGNFEVQLGGEQATRVLWVAAIEPDGILGLDVMRAVGAELFLKGGRYEMTFGSQKEETSTSHEEPQPHCSRVKVGRTLVVPPHSEVIIPGELVGDVTGIGVLEPTERLLKSNQLLLAKAVVNTGSPTIPLRVLNPTDEPRKVYRGTVAAICEPISELIDVNPVVATCKPRTPVEKGKPGQVPNHLVELLERSCKYLGPQQRQELGSLLAEYQHSFAKSSNDLGRTSLVEHRIDTGDARPIKQPPRRLPMHKRAEADKAVEQMLKDA